MAGSQQRICDWQPQRETSGLGTQEGQLSMHWLHWRYKEGAEFQKTEVPLTSLISCRHRQRACFLSLLESEMQDNGPLLKTKQLLFATARRRKPFSRSSGLLTYLPFRKFFPPCFPILLHFPRGNIFFSACSPTAG